MKEKVILAYSGGLDTTAIIPWLKENFDYEVICVCADCGQGEELDGLQERALSCGASKLYIEDLTDEFCDDYIVPCVQAHAVYENKYLLGTSMARPVIAKRLVEIARKEGATAICHGATGKGNDQIRFELAIKALAPDINIIAPWRNEKWTLDSREAEIEYCKQHGIHLPFSADTSYSRDRNLWHIRAILNCLISTREFNFSYIFFFKSSSVCSIFTFNPVILIIFHPLLTVLLQKQIVDYIHHILHIYPLFLLQSIDPLLI